MTNNRCSKCRNKTCVCHEGIFFIPVSWLFDCSTQLAHGNPLTLLYLLLPSDLNLFEQKIMIVPSLMTSTLSGSLQTFIRQPSSHGIIQQQSTSLFASSTKPRSFGQLVSSFLEWMNQLAHVVLFWGRICSCLGEILLVKELSILKLQTRLRQLQQQMFCLR